MLLLYRAGYHLLWYVVKTAAKVRRHKLLAMSVESQGERYDQSCSTDPLQDFEHDRVCIAEYIQFRGVALRPFRYSF